MVLVDGGGQRSAAKGCSCDGAAARDRAPRRPRIRCGCGSSRRRSAPSSSAGPSCWGSWASPSGTEAPDERGRRAADRAPAGAREGERSGRPGPSRLRTLRLRARRSARPEPEPTAAAPAGRPGRRLRRAGRPRPRQPGPARGRFGRTGAGGGRAGRRRLGVHLVAARPSGATATRDRERAGTDTGAQRRAAAASVLRRAAHGLGRRGREDPAPGRGRLYRPDGRCDRRSRRAG